MSSSSAATIPVYLASPSKDQGGIVLARLDTDSGALTEAEKITDTRVSFLAIHPSAKFLYGVGQDKVRAFSIDSKSHALNLLNEQPSGGGGPAHVSIAPSGKHAFVANYGGGTASVLPIHYDGSLAEPSSIVQHSGSGPNPKRQKEPHPHSIRLDPSEKIALVADLGLDQLRRYRFDPASSKLTAAEPAFIATPAGGGPRHFDFSKNGKFLYVDNEMGCSVTVFKYNADARAGGVVEVAVAEPIQTIPTLTSDPTDADTTSEIHLHPSGRFLYVANRGPNEIAAFAVDIATGLLTLVGHASTEGKTPRHFAIDPTGRWLLVANQDGDNVVVLKIDPQTGALSATGQSIQLDQPMCVLFPGF